MVITRIKLAAQLCIDGCSLLEFWVLASRYASSISENPATDLRCSSEVVLESRS